jgi:hypothetical protein
MRLFVLAISLAVLTAFPAYAADPQSVAPTAANKKVKEQKKADLEKKLSEAEKQAAKQPPVESKKTLTTRDAVPTGGGAQPVTHTITLTAEQELVLLKAAKKKNDKSDELTPGSLARVLSPDELLQQIVSQGLSVYERDQAGAGQ